MLTLAVVTLAALACGALYWRFVWFFRDPPRHAPAMSGVVAPADGTVVYVRKVGPGEPVVVVKRGQPATLKDLLRQDLDGTKLVIGIFMSPFNVHYNRAPIHGTIASIRHYPSSGRNRHMGAMHARVLLRRLPLYRGSLHIVENERMVTHFKGRGDDALLSAYVVQIGAATVHGIDAFFNEGDVVARGATFGMIRIGSQVDLVLPWHDAFDVAVTAGDRVRAGETLLVR